MEANDFLKNAERMCEIFIKNSCKGCPLYVTWRNAETNEIESQECLAENMHQFEDIATVIEIVEEWAEEHPQKTRRQDFFEKFPNAPKRNDNTPLVCVKNCGYCEICIHTTLDGCEKCWGKPLED